MARAKSEAPQRLWLAPLAIFLAACAVYLNSLGGEFVFDDTAVIQTNPQIRSLGWSGLKDLFGSHYWQAYAARGNLYRPVVMLSYALNYAAGELDPAGYHLVNVLLHAANAALVFLVIEQLFGERRFALWSGLLFALHPIRTEAVAYVVGRAESLAAFFFLLAWWLYLRGRALRAAAAFLLATLSKESAFTFLAVPLLSHFVKRERWNRQAFARYAALGVAAVVAVLLRYAVLGELAPQFIDRRMNPLSAAEPVTRLLTATHVFGKYLWLLLFPVPLSADYSFAQIALVTSPWTASFLAPAVALAALLAATAWAWRRSRALFFCSAFFLATFSLTSNFLRPIGTIMAERLLYLPSLGFTCAVAWAVTHAQRKDAAAAGAVVLALFYAGRTVARNADWKDHYSLFSSAAVVSPNSFVVQSNLAQALLRYRNDPAGAVEHGLLALRIHPGDPSAHMALGDAYRQLGQPARAAAAYHEVERLAPGTPGAGEAARRRQKLQPQMR